MLVSEPRPTELEPIGRFSRRSGIPVSHLRHYHEVGLLEPAYVDPESGYRYYAAAQKEAADVIGMLRAIDMPVRDIQRLLSDPSEDSVRSVLAQHRVRLEERLTKVAGRLESIDRIVKEGTLVKSKHGSRREGFVAVHVEGVTSQVPEASRWNELREKLSALPAEPQEVHVVTLVSEAGLRLLLWVGNFEGHALKLHLDGIKNERPLTYDLMLEALDRHGIRVVRADVTRIEDVVFFAELITRTGGKEQVFDCRPSDALNLALRAGAPLAVAKGVFDQAAAEDGDRTNAD